MLSKKQREEIFLEIDKKIELYFDINNSDLNGVYKISMLHVLVKMVIEPAGLDIYFFRNLTPIQKIEKTLECCKSIGFDEFNTRCIINIWAEQAYELLNDRK